MTDAEVADYLEMKLSTSCEIGLPGYERGKGKFLRQTRRGERNRKLALEMLSTGLAELRNVSTSATRKYAEKRVRSQIAGGIGGVLLMWIAGWFVDLVVKTLLDWYFNEGESQAWRERI